jgi:hypothetical protein
MEIGERPVWGLSEPTHFVRATMNWDAPPVPNNPKVNEAAE